MTFFKQYFALRDNPFDLTQGWKNVVNEQLATGLASSPILSHEEDALHELFIKEAGPFDAHIRKYERWLKVSSFIEGKSRGKRNYVALVAGHSGTGKTSLCSYMIRLLRKTGVDGREAWPLVETPRGMSSDLEVIRSLPGEIEKRIGDQKYCCILIDDLVAKALPDVCVLYRELKNKYFLHIFITTNDLDLIDRDYANWECPLRLFNTAGVDEDQATAFVAARVGMFRDPQLPILADRPFYPYDEQNIRDSVTNLKPDETDHAPVTLRVLGGRLHKKLENRLNRLLDTEPDYDIAASSIDQIKARTVDLLATGV